MPPPGQAITSWPPGQGPWLCHVPPGLQVGHLVVVDGYCFMGLYNLTCKVIQIFPNGEVSVRYDGGDDPRDAIDFTVRGDRLTCRPRRTPRVPSHFADFQCAEYKKCWYPQP